MIPSRSVSHNPSLSVPWIRAELRPQLDQYMALSKKDLMINITMNEMYNTHALILQHIDVLVSLHVTPRHAQL